jgi:hypothetical protein
MRNLIFTMSVVARMDMKQRHVQSHGRKSKTSKNKKKEMAKLMNPLKLLAHYNTSINEELFKT